IEQEIAAANARRAEVALELEQRRAALGRLEEQLRGQAETIERLRREREQAAPAAEPAPDSGAEDPTLADARQAVAAAAERRRDAPLIAARLDARTLPVRVEVLRAEIAGFEVEEAVLAARLARLQAELGARSTAALRELSAELTRLLEREPDAARHFAAEIAALRAGMDAAAETQSRIRAAQRAREAYAAIEDDLTRTLAAVRERLEVSGLTDAVGTLFLEERRRLRALGDFGAALDVVEREIAQARLRAIPLREAVRVATAEPTTAGVAENQGSATLRDLERRVLEAQAQGEETLIEQLRQTETQLRAVVALMDELEHILRETLLWWLSHVPISAEWARQAPGAFVALVEPEAWRETGAALHAITVESPGAALAVLALVALLFRAGRRAGSHLRRLAEKTQHRFTDSIGLTYRAIGWSLLRVLPAPVLMMAASLRLGALPEQEPGVAILAALLKTAAIWWLAGHLLALFISRNGVATVHFGSSPVLVERLRRDVKWYMPIQ